MKVRKKPVVVEAWLYDGSKKSIAEIARLSNAVMLYTDHLVIKTLEGDHRANIGDWIIKGIAGELYPCKPEIFEKTYERVEENGMHIRITSS